MERLRDEAFGLYLIARWDEAFHDFALRASLPPTLCNTDGDELVLVNDRFAFQPAARQEIEARLAAIDGVHGPATGESDRVYTFVRSGKGQDRESGGRSSERNVMIGRASVSIDSLAIETNSLRRADALRSTVEEACGALVRHSSREQADVHERLEEERNERASVEAPLQPPPAGSERLVLAFKEKHYADWADTPLPALGGRTPRDAVRTASGRAEVDVLLKEMENHEQHAPPGARFDYSRLRRELLARP